MNRVAGNSADPHAAVGMTDADAADLRELARRIETTRQYLAQLECDRHRILSRNPAAGAERVSDAAVDRCVEATVDLIAVNRQLQDYADEMYAQRESQLPIVEVAA